MKRFVAFVSFLVLYLLSASVMSDYLKNFTLEELTRRSSCIVRATVIAVDPHEYVEEVKLPFTRTTLRVTASLKGGLKTNTTIDVVQLGGLLPDGSFVVAVGTPHFTEDEDVIVFLNEKESTHFGSGYVTAALSQGKFNIENGKVFRNQNVILKLREGSRAIDVSQENDMLLDEFINNLRQCIGKEG